MFEVFKTYEDKHLNTRIVLQKMEWMFHLKHFDQVNRAL
jgi:hypothetical protein